MANFPYGAEFSPDVFDLGTVVAMITNASGSIDSLKRAIQSKYWKKAGRSSRSAKTMSMNSYLTLKSYGLIEETDRNTFIETPLLTEIKKQKSKQGMLDELNRHLIIKCDGFVFLKILEGLKAQDVQISMTSINAELVRYGYTNVNSTNKYISTMRAWLTLSDLFRGSSYDVNWGKVHSLLGLSRTDLQDNLDLTKDQVSFLTALVAIGESTIQVNEVCQYSRETLNRTLPEKNISTQVIRPLADLKYIDFKKRTKGRGAKPHSVSLKKNSKTEKLLELLAQVQNLPGDLKVAIAFPLSKILSEIGSPDKHKKGTALEYLAIWFTKALGLSFLEWRCRSRDTGGAEVDVLAERNLLTQERWQIQCKNTQSLIGSETIAREVGLAMASGSNVILIVTTSKYSPNAVSFAQKVRQRSMLKIILLDKSDLTEIVSNPANVASIVGGKTVNADTQIEQIDIHVEAKKLSETKIIEQKKDETLKKPKRKAIGKT